jgi:uncharacterized protein YqgV (UPF0045/DUF77 family)
MQQTISILPANSGHDLLCLNLSASSYFSTPIVGWRIVEILSERGLEHQALPYPVTLEGWEHATGIKAVRYPHNAVYDLKSKRRFNSPQEWIAFYEARIEQEVEVRLEKGPVWLHKCHGGNCSEQICECSL